MQEQAYRLYGFAALSFSSDTQDQAAMALMGRVEQFLAEMENRTLFFSLWWKALDDANASRLMQGAGDYTYWLEEMRHFKHTLRAEEKMSTSKRHRLRSGTLYDRCQPPHFK
jgi:oligoendopeptidase F